MVLVTYQPYGHWTMEIITVKQQGDFLSRTIDPCKLCLFLTFLYLIVRH